MNGAKPVCPIQRQPATRLFSAALLTACALGLGGCASTGTQARQQIEQTMTDRQSAPVVTLSEGRDSPKVRAATEALLAQPLTPETAVRVALVNNPDLRVTLAAANYAEADLIQAAKLPNPALTASTRWPSGGGPATNTLAASFDILDVFLIPLRKRLATEALTAAEQNAAHQALRLAGDVRVAWHRLAALEEWRTRLAAFNSEDESRAATLANAGKITRAHAAQQVGETREELARADAAIVVAREKLNLLMGLSDQPRWRLAGPEYALPATRANPEAMEQRAVSASLDLAAMRTETSLIKRGLNLEEETRWLPLGVQIGVESERESSGKRLTGPAVRIGVPLFDQGQADLLRLRTALEQAEGRTAALEADIRSQVRVAAGQMDAARRAAEACARLTKPQADKIWNELLRQSRQGQAGPLALHVARRDQIAATHREIESRCDYWRARTALVTTLGG